MQKYHLAIDIGASSGRHILAHLEGGKIVTEEVHRFSNGMIDREGTLCWDVDHLFLEIKSGLKKCCQIGKIPVSVGIDTWGVDFVLLDEQGQLIGDAAAYRDARTNGMDKKVYSIIPEAELYQRTGIQKQMFNTIFQLMAVREQHPEWLTKAHSLLMMPDYLHYLLSGEMATEYTIATTGQLVNLETRTWDFELIERLGYPKEIFQKILPPGSILGSLTENMQKEVGFNCQVVFPGSHDTASAVMAVPTNQSEVLYISSGTWSLLGTELTNATQVSLGSGCEFSHEGGYDYGICYLKNIMGLWMIQSIKKEIGQDLSFGEICAKASKEKISSIVNCNDERFMAPKSMLKAVQDACAESDQPIPQGIAEAAAVIYNSLAKCYADAIQELECITGSRYQQINIVGGGANADYLNILTAKASGREVHAGPIEATAIGNLTAQMITSGEIKDQKTARSMIYHSFGIEVYNC